MKPGAFTQLYAQLVFSPRNHEAALRKEIRETVFKYMGGIISQMGHKPYIVNGVSDHVHIMLGLNPNISISDTVRDIKRASSLFINEERLTRGKFSWQEGYGAFSYSRSHRERLYKYIENQELHHAKQTFRKEYIGFLKSFDTPYDEKYLFDFWATNV